ncbi:copper resistance CopC family protein [Isoptericola sp. b408]|uniref:copper resistance CopC family protein n=1 Tax=Isoptericola sp. b408 TaxID=3064653 RepID=UPI002713AB29|nr:copper resistance CopC family protein [Isoptericola sp. b408]MDO8149852.1 copper resistance protein CopC [Isoptericola sp. b408]
MAHHPEGSRPRSRPSAPSEGPDWTPVRSQRRNRLIAAVVALSMLLTAVGGTAVMLVGALSAGAHDQLLSTDPEDGASLEEPVENLTLTFSSDVIADGTQVRVTPPSGEPVDAEVTVDGPEVVAAVPGQAAGGEYEVAWRAVSSDGHPIEGSFAYEVAAPAADAGDDPAQAAETDDRAAAPSEQPGPSAPGQDDSSGAGGMPVLYGGALVAIIGVAALMLARSRRRLHDDHGQGPTQGPLS